MGYISIILRAVKQGALGMRFLFKRAESTESTTVHMQDYTRARTRHNLWMSPVTLNICSVDTFAFVRGLFKANKLYPFNRRESIKVILFSR